MKEASHSYDVFMYLCDLTLGRLGFGTKVDKPLFTLFMSRPTPGAETKSGTTAMKGDVVKEQIPKFKLRP